MANKNKKNIRLCVSGTPTSGKTFLINGLSKLLMDFDLTKDFPYHFQMLPGVNVRTIHEIKQDIKRNILNPGSGTRHSSGKEIVIDGETAHDNLYEFEYHNDLVKKSPNWFQRNFGNREKRNIHLRIRNIPGEMFDTFYKYRGGRNTIAALFSNFRNQEINSNELITRYKEVEIEHSEDLIRFRKRFIEFCRSELVATEIGDILQVEENFFRFLFYLNSTDIVVCHDIFLSATESYKQENFMSVFDPISDVDIVKKNVYYVFTKFDKAITNPEVNYVEESIHGLDDYWKFSNDLLNKIYKEDQSVSADLLTVINNLSERTFIDKILLDDYPRPILKHTFFVCTNYSNVNNNRGFLPFPTGEQIQSQDYAPDHWNENSYFNGSYPLGVLELLMSLLHRNGFCDCEKQNLGTFSNYDIIKQAFIE